MRLLGLVLALCWPVRSGWAAEGSVDFETQIRPILERRCLECHSPHHKVKGGLRLDLRAGWEVGGDAGPALTPGDPEKSLLVRAVRYDDPGLQMPPKRKLPAEEIALLENWVRQGAPDPRDGTVATTAPAIDWEQARTFWAYRAPTPPPTPTPAPGEWAATPIDRFIEAGWRADGLTPAPPAEPEALARRLWVRLIGLPPTAEELEIFARDYPADPERVLAETVDRLLASPHFGERWGRHWLDVARFAESSGGGRTLLFKDAWRYRDAVIEAFNRDLPFDAFLREQIAGDLMPADDPETRARRLVATAFLALGPTNYEEQDKQQLRFDIIDEQLDTLGRAFLGQTLSCARCHDHKFDPISHHDYYALAGIFASTRTLHNTTDNVARWIDTPLPVDAATAAALEEKDRTLAALRTELAGLEKELKNTRTAAQPVSMPAGRPLPLAGLPGVVVDDTQAVAVGEWVASQHQKTYLGEGYRHDNNEGKGSKTVTFIPDLPQAGRYEVRFAFPALAGRAQRVPVLVFHGDGEDTVFVDQTVAPPIEGRFVSLGVYRFEAGTQGHVLVSNEGTGGYVCVDAVQFLPEGGARPAAVEVAEQGAEANLRRRVQARKEKIAETEKQGPQRPLAMTVADGPEPGPTRIRVRGVEALKGAEVPRGFPAIFTFNDDHPVPADQSGRLALANWLTDPRHPLTHRVAVNRIWTWMFGEGLVRSVDNFGTTGEPPTHSELLDWLAFRFRELGGSTKALVREIALSRTWRLAAVGDAASAARDPENRRLARAFRVRLEAEVLRDALLLAAGELDLTVGGPNIRGAGVIDANDTGSQNIEYAYVFQDFRRGVYTPAFRNKRHELFEVFDFGDINAGQGRRHASAVAPQALYLMNHPWVRARAHAAAERVRTRPGEDLARVAHAWRTLLGRSPRPEEAQAALTFLGSGSPADTWPALTHTLITTADFRYLD
jgi:hypothetical protein